MASGALSLGRPGLKFSSSSSSSHPPMPSRLTTALRSLFMPAQHLMSVFSTRAITGYKIGVRTKKTLLRPNCRSNHSQSSSLFQVEKGSAGGRGSGGRGLGAGGGGGEAGGEAGEDGRHSHALPREAAPRQDGHCHQATRGPSGWQNFIFTFGLAWLTCHNGVKSAAVVLQKAAQPPR